VMISETRSVMRQICASMVFVIHVVIATFGVVVAPPAHAEGWRVGIYSGQWADTRLPYLPYNAATGRLTFSDSYLTSVIMSRHLLTRDLFIPYTSIGFSDARIEFEGTASLHRGLQTHEEVTLGVMLRTRDYDLASFGTINFGWANGFSYALSSPAHEYGTNLVRGQDTVQFQYYMGFEAEYAHASWDRLSVFTRLHHRSGIYGIISPSRTGSNIIGLGLRLSLGAE
jgi:hypothetical protein